jgi:hypothetical protein
MNINDVVYEYVNSEVVRLTYKGDTSAIFCLSEAFGKLSVLSDISIAISKDDLNKIAGMYSTPNMFGNYFTALYGLEFGSNNVKH